MYTRFFPLIFTILFLFSQPTAFASDPATRTVIDAAGRSVSLPENLQKIICIGPGSLRLIAYMGLTGKLVGVEEYETKRLKGRPYRYAHPELADLPLIGPGGPKTINREPNLEAVLQCGPDMIFATYMSPATADALQKKISIPVFLLSYGAVGGFDDSLYHSIRLLGNIFNRKRRAEQIITFVKHCRNDISHRSKNSEQLSLPHVYVGGIGYKGLQGLLSTDASYLPFAWTNASNSAARSGKTNHLFVDFETLLVWDPDIIFVDSFGLDLFARNYQKARQKYDVLQAFQTKKLFLLYPFNSYTANIGTIILNGYATGKILYPEHFKDIDLAEKATEIYTFLLGKSVYQEMKNDFGVLASPISPQRLTITSGR